MERVWRRALLAGVLLAGPLSWAQQLSQALPASSPPVENSAESLYLQLGSAGLDPRRVYHVRDAAIDRGAIHISLDDGSIAFTEDVRGRVTGACFEGDGEVLLQPPNRVERASMALFTGAAILEERFTTAYFRFNDATFADLQGSLNPADGGPEFVPRWNGTARNLAQADGLRLLLTFSKFLPTVRQKSSEEEAAKQRADDRMLHARLQGRKLGTFDLYYDSLANEQVWAGQPRIVDQAAYFDVWTSFAVRGSSKREQEISAVAGEEGKPGPVEIRRYKINAEVTPPKQLDADATLEMEVRQGGDRTLLFELSRFLQVKQVQADGHPIEFIHNPAMDGTQLARRGNDQLVVVFPRELRAGEKIRLRFQYGGQVLSDAGAGLLYVGARGTWYPNRGLAMADFDLGFRYPAGWTLVATGRRGEPAADWKQLEVPGQQVARWVSERPIPLAGFNLGKYTQVNAKAGSVAVETYATAGVEHGFPKPPPQQAVVPGMPSRPGVPQPMIDVTPPAPSPARNAQEVAERSAEAIDFYARRFGPYPYGKLSLTQMPGPLSQGWPGLIFLSSFSFLTPKEKTDLHLSNTDIVLGESVIAHETAHQWWGDLVSWSGYRDQWLMEALANYSSLMLLESKDPAKFRDVMAKYRDDLLQKNKEGQPLMDAGPVSLGTRLSSSHSPGGYEAISYGRGTWLVHMLRTMMRDGERKTDRRATAMGGAPTEEPFVRVLRKVREQYAGKAITTEELLRAFEQELPPSLWYENKKSLAWFYEQWINGTAVPRLELSSVKYNDKAGLTVVTGTLVQKSAPKDLVTSVPIFAVVQNRPVFLGRVFVEGAETPFRLSAPAGTRKLVVDPEQTVLARAR